MFFAKKPVPIASINDINHFVMNFYAVIQSNFVQLHRKITATLHARELHNHACHI